MKRVLALLAGAAWAGSFAMGAAAQEKIVGPWLWVVYPTEANQGGQASTDVDSFEIATDGAVTELDVAQNGAVEGDEVGGAVWTEGEIAATGGNNLNAMLTAIGLTGGDVDDHTAYGYIVVDAPMAQNNVTMRTGNDDSIKVWMNGEEVHRLAANRGAGNFQDNFQVNLKAGENKLLVKCSERGGGWSLFVGISAEFSAGGVDYAAPEFEPPPKLVGPYLWVIAPTAAGQGGAASTDIDSLDEASGGRVTEEFIAAWGPREGDEVGDYEWTEGEIAPTGGGNLNDMLTEIGLTDGLVDDYTAYGYINVISPTAQRAWGYAGSDDSVKVWVNGEVVGRKAVNEGASDYQIDFPIMLRGGPNPVLVKCSERGGGVDALLRHRGGAGAHLQHEPVSVGRSGRQVGDQLGRSQERSTLTGGGNAA